MFDAAGVSYPDENWTWDDLLSASQAIYDNTGNYGFMAYNDDQMGYWSFVYQAGGYILNEDFTRAGFDQPGTKKGMEFYVGMQSYDWCPKQAYFAETAPGTAFFSGIGSMYVEGNWELMNKCINFPNMDGKWDIAPMPKCPDPVSGDGRATISNGLCYSTAAKGKTRDIALDVIKFFGTEEAQLLASSYGAAISAYNGTEQPYFDAFEKAGYDINVEMVMDQFEYGVQNVNNSAKPKWKSPVLDELNKVYNGQQSLDEAQKTLETAEKNLANCSAVASIAGKVIGLTMKPGDEIAANTTVVTISDTSSLMVNATVDERNVSAVEAGTMVDLDQWGTTAMGTVESVSLSSTINNGVATYPMVISVDNSEETLQVNSYINYSLTASENDNCLILPLQAVRTVSTEEGETLTVVYVAGDKPETAVEGVMSDETIPEGYWPVPVEIGISDNYNVEIKSGVEEGTEVFTQVQSADPWGY